MGESRIVQITPITRDTRAYYEYPDMNRETSYPIVAIALVEGPDGSTEAKYLLQDDVGKLILLDENDKDLLYVH